MAKWLCQLLLALDYLQTQQVLHRDIKTSNLMLTAEDDVQLGDFGLATMMKEDGGCFGVCCCACLKRASTQPHATAAGRCCSP